MDVCGYETRTMDGRFQRTPHLFRIKPKDKLALHGFISLLKEYEVSLYPWNDNKIFFCAVRLEDAGD